jgi:hypothetical protein
MAAIRSFLLVLCSLAAAQAVTVYSQQPFGAARTATPTDGSPPPAYTGLGAYNPTKLNPPPPPSPLPANQFNIFLFPTTDNVQGASIATKGSFFGFSIEMSVTNQICEC